MILPLWRRQPERRNESLATLDSFDVIQPKSGVLPQSSACVKPPHHPGRCHTGSRAFPSAPFKLETRIDPAPAVHAGAFHTCTQLLLNKSPVLTRRPFKWAAVETGRQQAGGTHATRPGGKVTTGLRSSASAEIESTVFFSIVPQQTCARMHA